MRPAKRKHRVTSIDLALAAIKESGFIFRELNGSGWTPHGVGISAELFDKLFVLGLIEAGGDSLFDTPSQTWKIKEYLHVQECHDRL